MVAPCRAVVRAHPLLDHRPLAVAREKKAVMVDAEAVLHCRGINLGRHATIVRQPVTVDAEPGTELLQLERRAA